MIRILFVCHGNICRSPMAEFILKNMLEKQQLRKKFQVASAATSTEEIHGGRGNPVYPSARRELSRHGISCEGKTAVQVKKSDYDAYDYIIGMDSANIRNMLRIFEGDPEHKIAKLMDYTDQDGDVADPWYTDAFDIAYRDIEKGCRGLLNKLMGESSYDT